MDAEYFINLDYDVPFVGVKLQSEDGNRTHTFKIDDVHIIGKLLSKEKFDEYVMAVDNKMIEYVSSVVYDGSGQEIMSKLGALTSVRDSLKDYLSSRPTNGENNG